MRLGMSWLVLGEGLLIQAAGLIEPQKETQLKYVSLFSG